MTKPKRSPSRSRAARRPKLPSHAVALPQHAGAMPLPGRKKAEEPKRGK